jgi:hypothetical protein
MAWPGAQVAVTAELLVAEAVRVGQRGHDPHAGEELPQVSSQWKPYRPDTAISTAKAAPPTTSTRRSKGSAPEGVTAALAFVSLEIMASSSSGLARDPTRSRYAPPRPGLVRDR